MGKNQMTYPLKVHNRFTPKKSMHTPREGLYRSCINNCEISNLGFANVFDESKLQTIFPLKVHT